MFSGYTTKRTNKLKTVHGKQWKCNRRAVHHGKSNEIVCFLCLVSFGFIVLSDEGPETFVWVNPKSSELFMVQDQFRDFSTFWQGKTCNRRSWISRKNVSRITQVEEQLEN